MGTGDIPALTLMQPLGNLDSFLHEEKTGRSLPAFTAEFQQRKGRQDS
jgi:hypothetical protein